MIRIYLGWICVCIFIAITSGQLMPGSVPQLPNPALKVCLDEAGYDNVTEKYNNRFANAVNRWCTVYKKVLPCVDDLLYDTNGGIPLNPADWYFNMIYARKGANDTSRLMCKKLPKVGNKLPCMRPNVRRALNCVLKTTKAVRQVLMRLYMNNDTDSEVAKKGSCLIAAATAECFKVTMTKCPKYIRTFIGAYHIVLGGKCVRSIHSVDEVTPNPEENDEDKAESDWMSTIKSKLQSEIKVTMDPLIDGNEKTSFFAAVTESQVVKTVLSSPTISEEEEVYGVDESNDGDPNPINNTQTTQTTTVPQRPREPKRIKNNKKKPKKAKNDAPSEQFSIAFLVLIFTISRSLKL